MAAEFGSNWYDLVIVIVSTFGGTISILITRTLTQKTGLIKDEKKAKQLQEAIDEIITATSKAYVEARKKKSVDGELTEEEKKEAMGESLKAGVETLKQIGIKMGADTLRSKIESQYAALKEDWQKDIANELIYAVAKAVDATDQNFVYDLKDKNKDGRLTDAERKEALERSIKAVLDLLSTKGIEAGQKFLVSERGVKMNKKVIAIHIESYLHEKRKDGQKELNVSLIDKARQLYQQYAPKIQSILGADDIPEIEVEISNKVAIAGTAGTKLILNGEYFKTQDDDGAIIHEFAHIIHRAPTYDSITYWLIEGMADYVRHALGFDSNTSYPKYEKGKALAGYQNSAHFLLWLDRMNPNGLRVLSKHIMKDTYKSEVFKDIYGKSLPEISTMYEETN